MATYSGKISGTGVSATRLNELTADEIATLRNYIIGWDSGVVTGFDETHTTDKVEISSGLMFAYGYLGYLPQSVKFYFNPTAATQYHFIYGEFDKSTIPNTFIIKVKNNQGGSEPNDNTFRKDVLSVVKTGVYQLPLYRITLNADGIASVTDLRVERTHIKNVDNCDNTDHIEQSIASNVTATTQETSDNSTKVATTMFVHNACRDYIDNN